MHSIHSATDTNHHSSRTRYSRSPSPSQERRRENNRSRSPSHRRSTSHPRYTERTNGRSSDNDNPPPPPPPPEEEETIDPESIRANSRRECRVYVGNLVYDVRASDLKAFMRTAGNVVFSEILTAPSGASKGCGVVEYSAPEEAQKAIRDLTEKSLMGRKVFIREDRETEARYGLNPPQLANTTAGKQLFVSNLPYSVGWKELKDLFRNAGAIVRADVLSFPNGRSKGVGTVLYEETSGAQNAISTYEGYEWMGRKLEVREDKYPSSGSTRPQSRFPPPHRTMGGGRYGGPPPGYGAGGRYEYGGGYSHNYGGYADPYGGEYSRGSDGHYGGYYDSYGGGGGPARGGGGRYGAPTGRSAAGMQIYVSNLPFTTTTQDLKELFRSCGTITFAESLMLSNGRSKGAGVVRFASRESMERACTKFNGYVYGGRSLDVHEDRFV